MASGARTVFETMEYGPAPESAALAAAWLEERERKFGIYVGGAFRAPKSNQWFDAFNPADGQPIARIAQAGADDVAAAVRAAGEAQPAWAAQSGFERGRILYALARQLQKHSRLFAVLETLDNGKPIRETRDLDVPLAARHFYSHAGWARLLESEFADYEPIGVVGQIIPWNFPLLMLAWKIAPALAAGNTVVLKPAEFTSLSALLFAETCGAAGVPPGVVNIVTGDGETGKLLVEHPDVGKIAFTGSTEVGRIIRRATAGSGKKISLELGGKSPFLVFEDADQDSAIEGIVDAIWFNQGQVCCAGSRLLVQESIAERFLAKLRRRMESLRVGDPLDKAVDIGAIVAPVQLERISELVGKGVEEGAELFQPEWACPRDGWFYPPTLLTNVSPSSTVAQIEIFGPVLVAMTFRTPAEAVALANNTVYGLAASVWSENIGLAHEVAHRIKAGTVWVNCTNQFDAASGFGGYRESGFGREGGREGMFEYLRLRPMPAHAREDRKPARSSATPVPSLDRTYKQYIGGKQVRPDGGYSDAVLSPSGARLGETARGNRKDVRNAVEAALAAQPAWGALPGHGRAQILYFVAENLAARKADFVPLVAASEGIPEAAAAGQLEATVDALFCAAAWADKFEGAVHETPMKGVVYTRNEPLGAMGIVAPSSPSLLGAVKPLAFALALGNAAIVLAAEAAPLPFAEFVQVLETSDVPAGVANVLTGPRDEMARTLAEHEGVEGLWAFGDRELTRLVESASAGNLKPTWCPGPDRLGAGPALEREMLRRAVQVKNVWVPIGE